MSNGVGKTHLLFCLYIKYIFEKIEKGEISSCMFVKEYDLYFEIQETYKTDFYKSEREVMDKYISEKKLLAIDDLFSTKDNEFARQKIFTLLDKRTDYIGYPTIVTTNLSLNEINEIDTRIASRMDNEYFFDLSSLTKDFRKP
jgi:DNA replication protein DnaC